MAIYIKDAGQLYPLNYNRAPIYVKTVSSIHAKSREQNRDAYAQLDDLLADFHQGGGLDNIWQDYKLFSLIKLLEKFQPQSILELGAGTSTAIFADYVRSREGASLTSVDEYAQWSEKAREMAKINVEDSRFCMVVSPKAEGLHGKIPSSFYTQVPEGAYDFVFIDGPTIADAERGVNANIFTLLEYQQPRCIAVDVRRGTALALVKFLWEKYDIYISDILIDNLQDDYNYFSYFILKGCCDA